MALGPQTTPQTLFDPLLFEDEKLSHIPTDLTPLGTLAPAPLPSLSAVKPWDTENISKGEKADVARQKVDEGITALATALEAGNSEALCDTLPTPSVKTANRLL